MAVFTEVWNTSYEQEPSIVSLISQTGAQSFQSIKKGVRERMEIAHYWGLDDGSDGVHKFPTEDLAGEPLVSYEGDLYINTEAAALRVWYGDQWTQPLLQSGVKMVFVGNVVPDGWVYLPNYEDRTFITVPGDADLVDEGQQTGGSWTITGMNTAGAWSINQNFNTSQAQSVGGGDDGGFLSGGQHYHVVNITHSVSAHSHTFGSDWRPAYVYVFIASKV